MKRGRKAAWAVFALLTITALLLTACGQKLVATTPPPTEPPATPPPATEPPTATQPPTPDLDYSPDVPDPAEPVTITFASWVHTSEPDDAWTVMASEFHAIHPNITIEFVDVPFEEMADKLTTQVAAGNPPDAAYVDSPIVGDFGLRDALVQLDDYIAKSKVVDKTDYVDAFMRSATIDGKTFGLPIDGETTGLFYRTDRFQEAGLDPAKPPATWEEFKADADKLTDKANKKYGYEVFAQEAAYYWYPWLWQAGGDVISVTDPNDVIWDSPEGQEAANFYVDLVKNSPEDFLNSNSWDGRVAFTNGDVAMYMAGAWFAGTLLTENPDITDKWATAPLPTKNGKCATTIASDHLVVFSASKNPDAAYKWIEFVSAPDNMRELNIGTPESPATLLPPRLSLLNDPTLLESRPFLKGFAENMKCAVVSEWVQPRFGELESILNDYLGQAFYGKFPNGAAAVIQAAKDAEALLQE